MSVDGSDSAACPPPAGSGPAGAVFLSYASQDAGAARRICTALQCAGIEVWFDQSELRGGDAWDAKIRRQIKECALFVPLISSAIEADTLRMYLLYSKVLLLAGSAEGARTSAQPALDQGNSATWVWDRLFRAHVQFGDRAAAEKTM